MGGSSLAGLYGLARLVRFCLRGVLGLVARLGGSLGLRASSPPSVACRRHLPPRGTAFSGSCFAVAGIGALVVGQSIFESEFPPSVACRRHLPPRGTAFGLCFLSAWRIIDIKKAPTPLCGCLIGNLYVPKDTAYSVGRQSRLFYFAQFFL